MNWITTAQIETLHRKVLQKTGGSEGLRDKGALESALAAPMQTFGDQDLFPTEIEKIARIACGLTQNHPFVDGNKRIGLLVMQILLRRNGYRLHTEHLELSDVFLSIARGETDHIALTRWLEKRLR